MGHLKRVRHWSSFLDARYLMAGKCYHGRLGPCDDQLWDKTNYRPTVSIGMQLHGQVFAIVAFSFPASWEKSCMLTRSVASHWWSVHCSHLVVLAWKTQNIYIYTPLPWPFLPRSDFFSAATYSHVTVTSSAVACTNVDISASCVLSRKKGWQDLLSLETRPIVVLACQSSRISAIMANFRIFRRVHLGHASNTMAISHWILRFGNNL